jgi:Flp pilus assembly protein TadG
MMRNQRGAALLEFALIVPVFLLLILGAMDLLLCEMAKSNLSYITTQAANCAAKKGCDVKGYVDSAAGGLSMDGKSISISQKGDTVTLSTHYNPIGPVFPSITLSATATAVE